MANRSATIHRKKFGGGRRTPQEVHAAYAFPSHARCGGCGAKPSMRAVVMAPFDEANKRGMLPANALLNAQVLQAVVQLKGSDGKPEPYIRLSCVFSCSRCASTFEKELAKAPSWCFVDITRGPDPTNRVVVGAS